MKKILALALLITILQINSANAFFSSIANFFSGSKTEETVAEPTTTKGMIEGQIKETCNQYIEQAQKFVDENDTMGFEMLSKLYRESKCKDFTNVSIDKIDNFIPLD